MLNTIENIEMFKDLNIWEFTRELEAIKKIDLKHLIFELIVLNLPKKRKHTVDKQGKSTCNKEMVDLVNKYTQIKEQASDPRWDALKKIKIKL